MSKHSSIIAAALVMVTVLEPIINFGERNYMVTFVGETQTCLFAEQELIQRQVLKPLHDRIVICDETEEKQPNHI